MIERQQVLASNEQCKTLEDLVTVLVGATGGIGSSTAKAIFRCTARPKVYIVGRDQKRGDALCEELRQINPGGKAIFIRQDVSLLRNVDETCAELIGKEKKINCLFLTAGYMTIKGRNETDEGLDRKMCVNYYSRMRWIQKLMPALTAAAEANQLSRVISVLAAGSEADINVDDLDLKHHFTLHACLAHCTVMTDFAMEEFAKRYPNTSFSHSYPGTVKTGIANELNAPVRLAVKLLYAIMTPWLINVQESGERHFFQMTSQCYSSANGGVGVPCPEGLTVMQGADGKIGSGAYLLDWDGKPTGDLKVLQKYRDMNLGPKIWEHTLEMFAQAEKFKRNAKRRASGGDAEERLGRDTSDPIGWRPG